MRFLSLSFFQASPELTETSQDRWFPKEGKFVCPSPWAGAEPRLCTLAVPRDQRPARPGHSRPNEFLTARNIPPDHITSGRGGHTAVSQANILE